MKILLTGATGFIGRRLLAALRRSGHEVVCAGRHRPPQCGEFRPIDFADALDARDWVPQLGGIEVVVNTVGVFRERGPQTFERLHERAPVALFDACARAGVRRVVQLSALGADAGARTRYHLSKRVADEHLLRLPLQACVVQPSLVFGPDGPSARMFLGLASLPLLPLPEGGVQRVQPVHVDDVVQALVALVEGPRPSSGRVPLVGPEALTLAQYLQALRAAMGLGKARVLALPGWSVAIVARLGDLTGHGWLDSASWSMLTRGNTAQAEDITRLLGRAPRPVEAFIGPAWATASRVQARLAWLLPVLRVSVALVWLLTALVSAGLYPVQESYALLGRAGVPAALQPLLLYGACALDAVFGLLSAFPPRPPWRRRLWAAQAALIAGYSAIIAWKLPEFWLHPYGPLTKNLPMLAALLLLALLEDEER